MKILNTLAVVSSMIMGIQSQAIANCDKVKTETEIKIDLEEMFQPIKISKLKITKNPFSSTASYIDPADPKEVTYLVYFETTARSVKGLPVEGGSFIGGYNVEARTSCRPLFLGAQ